MSTEQMNEPAAVNKEPALKPLDKASSLDSGPSLLAIGIYCFSARELMCVFALVRGITHCNGPFRPSSTFSLAKGLVAIACNGNDLATAVPRATWAPMQAASPAPAFWGEPEPGWMKWKRSNQVDFSSLVPCKASYLHSCGSLLNMSAF